MRAVEFVQLLLTVLGGVVLALGLASKWLEKSPVPPTVAALLIGIALGPVLGVIDLDAVAEPALLLENIARVTLAIGLVGVALRIPPRFPRRNARQALTLVVLGMVLMWSISTLLVYLILGLPLALSALIGAMITATDPVAAAPIVTGPVAERSLPERIRHTISLESGANDGLSYLFVFLPFLLLTRPEGEALGHWVTQTLAWDVGVATVFGLVLGVLAGRMLMASEQRSAIAPHWRLVYTVALSLVAVGGGRLLGSDEVLVVFAAGAAFVQVVRNEDRTHEMEGHEGVNRFFAVPIFVLVGVAIPWEGWLALGWSGLLLVGAVLLLRRPPVLLLLRPLLPNLHGLQDALFVGWFGPIAVAAVYYAALMEHRLGEPLVWHVVSLVVCSSVVVHGVTAVPFTRWYARRAACEAEANGDP